MRERNLNRALYAAAGVVSAVLLTIAYSHPAYTAPLKPVAQGTGKASATKSAATASASASPSASGAPVYTTAPLLEPAKKYLGVAMDGVPNSMTGLTDFSTEIGKAPNIVAYYVPWGQPVNQTWILETLQAGALPLIQFEPATPSIASIAAGSTDAYTQSLAQTIRALNVPVVVSFGHEMNGDWYAWGTTKTTPASFVKAWQRLHGIFVKAGATNAIWLWNVNVTYPVPNIPLKPLYPGDAYVDWIGVTGYFNIGAGGRSTYNTLFVPTMDEVRGFTKKPFLLAETGASPSSEKPAEIESLFAGVQDHSDVLGFVWFDYDKTGQNEADWMIDSDATSASTFARLAKGSDWGFTVKP
jgi:hypothetical protein